MNQPTMTKGIRLAVIAAGNQQNLAEKLGVSQQVVSRWMRRGWVPVDRAQEIEALLGISRKSLLKPRLVELVDSNIAADFEA